MENSRTIQNIQPDEQISCNIKPNCYVEHAAGVILWFGDITNSSEDIISKITNLCFIIKSEYSEFPVKIEQYKYLSQKFKIQSIISAYRPFFIYCIVTELDKAELALRLFLDVREVRLLLFYTQGRREFKLQSANNPKFTNGKVLIENDVLKVLFAIQQFIRPQLSVMKWGRRNSLSKAATMYYDLKHKENEVRLANVIVCDLNNYKSNYHLRQIDLEDDEGLVYNICEERKDEDIDFKTSRLLEEIMSPLGLTFNPEKHFSRFKTLILNSFKKKSIFDLDVNSRTYYYTKNIEKCHNLKDLCLTMLQKYYFCEDKKLNQQVNHIFKNIEKYRTDPSLRETLEDFKYIIMAILLAFNKDYHEDKPPKIIYRTCHIEQLDKLHQGSLAYSYQIIDGQYSSLFRKKKLKRKQTKSVSFDDVKEKNIEFMIKFGKMKDRFFRSVISLTNRETTSKQKKIHIFLVFPLTRMIICNVEMSEGKHYVLMEARQSYNFIHLITTFSYNLTLEVMLETIKIKRLRKMVSEQIDLLKNYKEYLNQFICFPYAACILNFQIAVLTYFTGNYSDAQFEFQETESLLKSAKVLLKEKGKIDKSNLFTGEINYYRGKCYFNLKKFEIAIEILNAAIEWYKLDDIFDSLTIADIQAMLGSYYANVLNNKEMSFKCYEKEQSILYNVFNGEESIYLAKAYNHLGCVQHKFNLFNEAIECFKKDLEITLKLLGKDHFETAIAYHNLATLYEFNDLNSTAIEYSRIGKAIAVKYL